ncbi:MAG: type II toxin-antitoxin system VapC family toxin [Armatimonadota bacterium]|nr:type II toxin-antitoxin system VapC family toxin [Armatimonadota bacterium]
MQFLLDTNILLAHIRLGTLGQYLKAVYNLYALQPAPIISIVTEGEIRAIALRHNWGVAKLAELQRLLNALTIVPLPYRNVIETYARIDHHCVTNGLALGKNDLWIAATAQVTGATILTTDRDFDPLHGLFLQRNWIDPASRL